MGTSPPPDPPHVHTRTGGHTHVKDFFGPGPRNSVRDGPYFGFAKTKHLNFRSISNG